MDYHSKFEFDKELKENLNLENIPESSIDAHFKKFEAIKKAVPEKDKQYYNVCFSQLNELTGMLGKFKFPLTKKRKHKLVKCYVNNEIDRPLIPNNEGIKNRHYLSLYTIGGFRYFVSIQLPILQVFPLEDGLIVKCKYDPKLLRVSFREMRRDPSYAYITLTDHPLEDLRPLSIKYSEKDIEPTFGARKTLHNMIDTKYDLLFVSDTLPIAVLFDEIKSEVVFATLRKNKSDNPDMDLSEEVSFESFFKKERHSVISHISNTSQLVLNQITTDFIDSGVKPDQFEIVDSFEENTFYIVAFFSLLNQAKFYRCLIGKGQDVISIKLSAKVTNVAKILSIDFLSQNEMSIPKVCTRRVAKKAHNYEAEYLKEKIREEFHKEVVLLDSSGSLHVYKGDLPLISFLSDVDIPMLLSPNFEVGSVITDISNPKDSRLTLQFNNNEVKRVDLQFKGKFRDFVLQSCLNVLQQILPLEVFYKFYEHLLYVTLIPHGDKAPSQMTAWEAFTELFFVLLDKDFNREIEVIPQPTFSKNSAFTKMLNSKTGKQLLKGFKQNVIKSDNLPQSVDYSHLYLSRFKQKVSLRELQEFKNCAKDMFEVFHLLHEDMRLNVFNTKLLQNGVLVDFLLKMCLKLGPTHFTYSEFYIKEYPELVIKYAEKYREYREEYILQIREAKEQMTKNKTNANFIIPAVLSKTMSTVPSIYAWVESKLDSNQTNYEANYFCFFETSRKVCRLFDIFNEGEKETRSALHPLLTKPKYEDDQMEVEMEIDTDLYPLYGCADEFKDTPTTFNSTDYYLNNRNLNYFERIVFALKEERMGRDSIKKLPLGISLPLQEVLSHQYFKTIYVKSNESEKRIIEEWPKEIFKLIEREDLYYNFQETKKNKNISEEATPEFQFSRVSTLNLNKTLSKRRSTFKLGRTESNIFANMKKSIVQPKGAVTNKVKQTQGNSEEAEAQEYMDLVEKEFKSLGLKNKKISENHFINYRFSSDLRYMEVCLMLDSSIPFKLRIDKVEGIEQMTVEELDTVKHMIHEQRVIRQFAKCVGRGALKLGTIHTVPTEKLKIPEI